MKRWSISALWQNLYFRLPLFVRQWIAHITSTLVLMHLLLLAFKEQILVELDAIHHRHKGSYIKILLNVCWNTVEMLSDAISELISYLWLRKHKLPSMAVCDYVEHYGFGCEDFIVTTDDGYNLLIHHLFAVNARGSRKMPTQPYPILLQHGLFQSAGVFVTSGRNSLAFWLLDRGYDVWLGNNRGVPCNWRTSRLCTKGASVSAHQYLNPSDKTVWEWTVDDLGKFDFPALVLFVLQKTKRPQLHYVGHSQGNAQAFIGLSSDIGEFIRPKLRSFTALAPAVSIGPLIQRMPLRKIIQMSNPGSRLAYLTLFCENEFIPLMTFIHRLFPEKLFMSLAFRMFAFLFHWTDRNWSADRKPHYFRFTPRPTSSRSILHWTDIAKNGWLHPFVPCQHVSSRSFAPSSQSVPTSPLGKGFARNPVVVELQSTPVSPRSADNINSPVNSEISLINGFLNDMGKAYDLSLLYQVPLLLIWGDSDYLIDPVKMLQVFEDYQLRGRPMNILLKEGVEGYEHLDFMWAKDAEQEVWLKIEKIYKRLDSQ